MGMQGSTLQAAAHVFHVGLCNVVVAVDDDDAMCMRLCPTMHTNPPL